MIKKYQKEVDDWFRKKDWDYWAPCEITTRLSEEVGEFAREVLHRYGPKKKRADQEKSDIEEEMGDIIYTLICFANANDLNLDRGIRRSLDTVTSRDKNRFNKK